MADCIAALGANIPSSVGTPIDTVKCAIRMLGEKGLHVKAISQFYRTTAVPASDQPDFVNCAIILETNLQADALLDVFHTIEHQLGRTRDERWSARMIDIDLIAYADHVLPDVEAWHALVNDPDPAIYTIDPMIPHPRAHKRGFVLIPILDIMPHWQHPVYETTARDLYMKLGDVEKAGISIFQEL